MMIATIIMANAGAHAAQKPRAIFLAGEFFSLSEEISRITFTGNPYGTLSSAGICLTFWIN